VGLGADKEANETEGGGCTGLSPVRHTQKMVHSGATALLTSLAPCASDANDAVNTCSESRESWRAAGGISKSTGLTQR
jgi:hypothetical protein